MIILIIKIVEKVKESMQQKKDKEMEDKKLEESAERETSSRGAGEDHNIRPSAVMHKINTHPKN